MSRPHHHHFHLSYPVKFIPRLYSIFITPLLILGIVFLGLQLFGAGSTISNISPETIATAIFATFLRLLIAYILALVVSIPLAYLSHKNATIEKILLPLFDILQSVPVLAFFPIIVLFFVKFNMLDLAAIFILFLAMVWNIVFSLVGGLKVIPSEITEAAEIFKVKGFSYFLKVALPAVVPYLVTGSLLAWAQGWNIIIVAEVLHTYIPAGAASQDLFGIGSILVQSISSGNTTAFLYALVGMVLAIALLNFLIWQKLLRVSERFRFE